ncbi:MAG: efflux RND transporter periplasmic adaptor subunit [Gemmatimonadota bacterium]
MSRAPIGAILALAPALLAACGDRRAAEAPPPPSDEQIVPVQTARAELGSLTRTATVSGSIEPIRRVFVNSQMSSEVVGVEAEEGDAVSAGQVLARLDDRQLQSQLASAEASFEVTEAAFERARQLREREVITQAEYDQARTEHAAATARLELVRTQLEYSVIRAPIDGVVTERNLEVGNIVSPQTRLFSIDDISTMVVLVRVSELDVVHLRPGVEVEVALDAFPDRSFPGRIRRVFPAADPATRLVPVEVALSGEGNRLARPGFLARVTFRLESRDGVVLVPLRAILAQSGGDAVFVVEEGHAYRRTVTTGLISEERIEIVQALEAGEEVIVEGQSTLRDGAAVRVVAPGSPLEATSAVGGSR